jgi:hypothetical protein
MTGSEVRIAMFFLSGLFGFLVTNFKALVNAGFSGLLKNKPLRPKTGLWAI